MSHRFEIREAGWDADKHLLMAVRHPVFVDEQNVPASIEIDEYDPISIHILAMDREGHPIGTARLLPEGKIGRVAVLAAWRKQGVGRSLMEHLISIARNRSDRQLTLHAQSWTIPFYQSIGFETEGSEFEEAGIPHRKMKRFLY